MPISATHEKYANFYTDFAFKKLFGTEANKECLIGFLNSLFDGEEEILDVTYRESQKQMWDLYSVTTTAEKKGIAKGRAEGRAEGLVEGRAEGLVEGRAEGLIEGEAIGVEKRNVQIARNLKAMGMSLDQIS